MKNWSFSISYRLGLGFHAMNNEGSDGSNLMQPRRIDVGRTTYDGISGEMVRRHVIENFVLECESQNIPLLTASKALHPDRGPLGLREAAKKHLSKDLLDSVNVFDAARSAIEHCALVDAGGYLAAFSDKETGEGIPESQFLKEIAKHSKPTTVKRDSVFDVGWLISEKPQEMTVTQHAAYRPTGDQSLFSQSMRSNVYAGVMRANLYRIGTDDYWYLANKGRLAISEAQQLLRQKALIKAMTNFVASPAGAKNAAWAPHVTKIEGVILLTSARTAPFFSPITIDVDGEEPIHHNPSYKSQATELANDTDTWTWEFQDAKSLLASVDGLAKKLDGV